MDHSKQGGRATMKPSANQAQLIDEGRRLGRYLVGRPVPLDLLARYQQAHVKRAADLDGDSPALALWRRRPWMLPLLDAGCARWRPEDPLRRKLMLMTAILECTPRYAEHFLPEHRGFWALALRVVWHGACGVVALAGARLLCPQLRRFQH